MKTIKPMSKKLELSKQTLRALTGEALAQVGGGGDRRAPISFPNCGTSDALASCGNAAACVVKG